MGAGGRGTADAGRVRLLAEPRSMGACPNRRPHAGRIRHCGQRPPPPTTGHPPQLGCSFARLLRTHSAQPLIRSPAARATCSWPSCRPRHLMTMPRSSTKSWMSTRWACVVRGRIPAGFRCWVLKSLSEGAPPFRANAVVAGEGAHLGRCPQQQLCTQGMQRDL